MGAKKEEDPVWAPFLKKKKKSLVMKMTMGPCPTRLSLITILIRNTRSGAAPYEEEEKVYGRGEKRKNEHGAITITD